MHFRHRQTDRQTDTDIIALARDVYIASRAKITNMRTLKAGEPRAIDVTRRVARLPLRQLLKLVFFLFQNS